MGAVFVLYWLVNWDLSLPSPAGKGDHEVVDEENKVCTINRLSYMHILSQCKEIS